MKAVYPVTRFIFSDLLERVAPERDKRRRQRPCRLFNKTGLATIQKTIFRNNHHSPNLKKVTKVTKVTHQKTFYFSHVGTIGQKLRYSKLDKLEQPYKGTIP